MKTNIELAKERERFEAWASDNGTFPKDVERDEGDSYKLMQTHMYWMAWQAAIEQATQQYKQRIEEMERMVAMLREHVRHSYGCNVGILILGNQHGETYPCTCGAQEALAESSRAAGQYEKRIKAEALEELLMRYAFFSSQEGDWLKSGIEKDLAELEGE